MRAPIDQSRDPSAFFVCAACGRSLRTDELVVVGERPDLEQCDACDSPITTILGCPDCRLESSIELRAQRGSTVRIVAHDADCPYTPEGLAPA